MDITTVYIGVIGSFGFNYAPYGWMRCTGQSLQINQYQALFSLLGIYYGGDGKSTFNLPNLQGREIIGYGQGSNGGHNYTIGMNGGLESVSLTSSTTPFHTHQPSNTPGAASMDQGTNVAKGNVIGGGTDSMYTSTGNPNVNLSPFSITVGYAGGNATHTVDSFNVIAPYLSINYCIATQGSYPVRP